MRTRDIMGFRQAPSPLDVGLRGFGTNGTTSPPWQAVVGTVPKLSQDPTPPYWPIGVPIISSTNQINMSTPPDVYQRAYIAAKSPATWVTPQQYALAYAIPTLRATVFDKYIPRTSGGISMTGAMGLPTSTLIGSSPAPIGTNVASIPSGTLNIAGVTPTNWLLIGTAAAAVWYFFLRK